MMGSRLHHNSKISTRYPRDKLPHDRPVLQISLAFINLYAEGSAKYVESFAYARQAITDGEADVDHIEGFSCYLN